MFLVKHKEHGNRHVASLDEAKALQGQGWTKWPRTKDEKLGIAPKPAAPPVQQPKSPELGKAVSGTLKP